VSQQSQRTDVNLTEGYSQLNALAFPEQLAGNSIDPLGSGYLRPAIFTHIGDVLWGVLEGNDPETDIDE